MSDGESSIGNVLLSLIATIVSLSLLAIVLYFEDEAYDTPEFEGFSHKEDLIIEDDYFLLLSSSPTFHKPQVTASGVPVRVGKTILAELSGYSSTPCQTNSQPFITASGKRVRDGIVAANFLDFGTEIRIPQIYGDKIFVVKDRMNFRYSPPYDHLPHQGFIDIWFPNRTEALNFGRIQTKVEILE